MHCLKPIAILIAVLLGIFSNNVADAALRASVSMFLFTASRQQDWIRSVELRRVFGPFIYAALRRLHRDGVIERKEAPAAQPSLRGGYLDVWYRWKEPSK